MRRMKFIDHQNGNINFQSRASSMEIYLEMLRFRIGWILRTWGRTDVPGAFPLLCGPDLFQSDPHRAGQWLLFTWL